MAIVPSQYNADMEDMFTASTVDINDGVGHQLNTKESNFLMLGKDGSPSRLQS